MSGAATHVALVSALALIMTIFVIVADAGSCGINISGLQGCMPSVTKPKIQAPCCKIMKGFDWSCLCFVDGGFINKLGFDPMFPINIAYGCSYVTPGVCS